MHLVYPLGFAAVLFAIGAYGVLARRNAILVLISVELMLSAVNLNLVAFDVWRGDALRAGQVLALFVIVIAAAEVGLGLAIVLLVFRTRGTADVDRARDLAERDGPPGSSGDAASGPADPTSPPGDDAASGPAEPGDGARGAPAREDAAR